MVKRLAIMVAAVLAVSLAVCTAGLVVLEGILEEAHGMATEIGVYMERGDGEAAKEGLVRLANRWEESMGVLEVLCDHDDLHAVQEKIIQAEICAEHTDMEDFYASVMLIGANLEHIRDEEALRLSNLY